MISVRLLWPFQVPVRYRLDDHDGITVVGSDGVKHHSSELNLEPALSRAVFGRTGEIARIEVSLRRRGGRRRR